MRNAIRRAGAPSVAAVVAFALVLGAGVAFGLSSPTARRFGAMGVEHILLGFDHLTFLAMLAVAVRRTKELIWLASAFTVAHSLTLSAAVLEWVQASPAWVEPAIVATILYLALENALASAPRARPGLTFGFGLVHGLGFAGALAQGPLPRAEELLALFSFNLGVEAGQALFLAVGYLLWRLGLRYCAPERARRIAGGAAILLCGYWLWRLTGGLAV